MAKHTTVSIRYQIAQKVRNWRLKQKYTLKDLVGKTGINYHTLLRYEQGTCGIPIKRLKVIANALSIPVKNLFPRRKVLREDSCFDKAKTEEMCNFMGKYKKTGGHKAIYALTKSVRAEEESNIKAARIKIAKDLVKAGFNTDIIYRATGLSIEDYADKERYEPNGGQEIKKWRIIRGYTQEELAKKLNVGPSQIHHYEQGSGTLFSERLWEIARELSVSYKNFSTVMVAHNVAVLSYALGNSDRSLEVFNGMLKELGSNSPHAEVIKSNIKIVENGLRRVSFTKPSQGFLLLPTNINGHKNKGLEY